MSDVMFISVMRTTRITSIVVIAGALLFAPGCESSSNQHSSRPQYQLVDRTPVTRADSSATKTASHQDDAPVAIEIEPWRFGAFPGRIIDTAHYRIHTTIDQRWARTDLPRFCEAALANYRTALGPLPAPARELETYMFATRTQWRAKAADLLPGQADAYRNLGRGGLSTGGIAVLYYIDYYDRPRDTFAIAAHEGWHQYTQTTFKNQMPVWLEEGIAAYMEGFHQTTDGEFIFDAARNYERRRTLRRAVMDERLITLQQMVNRSPTAFLQSGKDELLVYYAQGWAMCRFLVEGEDGRYADAFHKLLLDAAEGRLIDALTGFSPRSVSLRRASLATAGSGDTVIRVYFNGDVAEFERQYRTFISKILDEPLLTRPRGSDRPGVQDGS